MASIIFDLDGTLIDSAPDIHAAVNRTLADEGAPALDFALVRSFIGNGVPVLIERVMAARGESEDPARHAVLLGRFLAHYTRASADLTQMFDGVAEALSTLRGQGHALGICTNKPVAPTKVILQAFGLAKTFDVVIGGDSLPLRKPDPAPLRAAAQALGQGPALYVGDSEVDAETAVNAGMPLVLFTRGYRKAAVGDLPHARSFQDFSDLPGIVAALLEQ